MIEGAPMQVLMVEDNLDHAELIRRSFEDHQVLNMMHHVHDGEEALDYLMRRKEYADVEQYPTPHLVLLDLRLPKVDGLTVLKEMKETEHLCRIPVVVLTSSAAEQDMVQAYQYHANSYLTKPLDFVKFTKLMKDLGFYWLGWNKSPISE
jgi:CheY-like chemotaxis protein